jgi:hypothetical protein
MNGGETKQWVKNEKKGEAMLEAGRSTEELIVEHFKLLHYKIV